VVKGYRLQLGFVRLVNTPFLKGRKKLVEQYCQRVESLSLQTIQTIQLRLWEGVMSVKVRRRRVNSALAGE